MYFRCPVVEPGRDSILKALGAKETGEFTIRMFRGAPYEHERAGVFSLGCPGKG
jgi:hypothetical protein